VHRTWYFSCSEVHVAFALDGARAIAGLEFLPLRLAWWAKEAAVDQVANVLGRAVVVVVTFDVDAARQTGLMGFLVSTIDLFRNG
jgi:hypothetical protein